MTHFLRNIFRDDANANDMRILFRILVISLASLHTWAAISSQSMNADGINYLDIGDAYFRGDWGNAINPVWPPLYSWVLGLINFVFKPAMAWEFPIVHVVNFVIFLGTLACFEFMWGKLRLYAPTAKFITLPNWAWWATGYSMFIWVSLSLIQIWAVTPDMLMSALVYLAGGWIAHIRSESHPRWKTFLYLGVVLGLGYLTKTIMFSIALVFLGISALLVRRKWSSIAKPLLAALVFLLLSLPFIFLISEKVGKLTIGEAGTVTYTRYVDGIPFPHWQGNPNQGIVLTHPSRLIHQSPPIYEFAEPIGGTYPISTDPSYWYAGIKIRFDLQRQLARLLASSLFYLEIFFQKQGVFLACIFAIYMMMPRQRLPIFEVIKRWALVIPAIVAFGLYGLVLVADRYIGVFVLLFWADILANIRLPDTKSNRSWIRALSAIAIVGLFTNILLFNLDGFNRLNPSLSTDRGKQINLPPAGPVEVAQALGQQGVEQGERVAVIGYGFDSFWARLARVKIVVEMLESDANEFWLGDTALQQNVLSAFASTGAKVVVAEYVPGYARLDGWQQIGASNYFVYQLEK